MTVCLSQGQTDFSTEDENFPHNILHNIQLNEQGKDLHG